MGGVIVANTGWLEQNREVATAYVAEVLLDNRRAASDQKLMEEAVKKYQTEAELKAFPKTYESYQRDLGGFPQNGGSTPERVRTAIGLFTELDLVKPGLTVEQVADTTLLEGGLRLIGSVQGKL
jgi:ABC-type nitrate/sulfonate/bicarbonate transport system substrate-binding protein